MEYFLNFSDQSLLLLRLIVALIFITSGYKHMKDPVGRGESIGMSPIFTFLLGSVEFLSSITLITGYFIQIGASALVLVMSGAIYKKALVWKTGFWGKGSQGWHYDLLLLLCNLVFLTNY
jgi:putative oxidoreductase